MLFKQAASKVGNKTVTTNLMPAKVSTKNAVLDLFFLGGAARKVDVTPLFDVAYEQDKQLAMRVALWLRDARGGAGERETFRRCLRWLEAHGATTKAYLARVPEVGRWDDLLEIVESNKDAQQLIVKALRNENGLCAKWMPRQGKIAMLFCKLLGWSPKQWRKELVRLTKVVEQQMSAREWQEINYQHVPSVAMARYAKAFGKRDKERFEAYKQALAQGKAKVHAGVVFPHDVVRGLRNAPQEAVLFEEQWKALPKIPTQGILPIVDVSGSMTVTVSGGITAMDISLGMGVYCSEQNTGAFKDLIVTFSNKPAFVKLKGTLSSKLNQLARVPWGMNTDLEAALILVLSTATKYNVAQVDMPRMLLILSDMQFDSCTSGTDAFKMIKQMYSAAGYKMPEIVFWNLNSPQEQNVPVTQHKSGAALVSGYSTQVLKSVVDGCIEPESIMLKAIMTERYAW